MKKNLVDINMDALEILRYIQNDKLFNFNVS